MEEAEELLMLRESAVAKAEFRKLSLSKFWLQQHETYPRFCNKAAQMFLPFPTTYLCEAGFSVMFDLKPKKRNRLEMSSDIRLACSETKSNIFKLVVDCKVQARIEIEIRIFDKIEAGSTESARRPLGVHEPNPVGNHWCILLHFDKKINGPRHFSYWVGGPWQETSWEPLI